jgi:3-deoxy-D-manno-octulosonic-acid transferase
VQVCQRQGVLLALVNARLNERSWRQAQRLRWLSRPAYAGLTAVLAQTPRDAERLASLGARVTGVWGNLKFDAQPDAAQCVQGQRWRQRLARPVVLLASSREGEEALFLKEIMALSLDGIEQSATDFDVSDIQWLVVPRHPQRFDVVAGLIEAAGWVCERRVQWGEQLAHGAAVAPTQDSIWLGDSLGEMALYYSLADVALLGGSFEPLGGQNLIEAAACACPVVMGPHTFNFAEAADQAETAGAARRVSGMAQGLRAAVAWLANPEQRQVAKDAAKRFSRSHQGAAAATAAAVASLLPPPAGDRRGQAG